MRRTSSRLLGVSGQALVAISFMGACSGVPRILSPYGSRYAVSPHADGTPRLRDRPHDGVDVAADVGEAVIASAPGRIVSIEFDPKIGFEITIAHDGFPLDSQSRGAVRHTSYTHVNKPIIRMHDRILRGQQLGEVGLFWASGGVTHVHWKMCRGSCRSDTTLDPLSTDVRCFSVRNHYPENEFILTYPIMC